MLMTVVLAVAWPAGPGVEALSRAFWIHQAVAAVGTVVFVRWLTSVAARGPGSPPPNVIRFPSRP